MLTTPRSLLAGTLVGAFLLAPRTATACSLASPWGNSTWQPARVTFLGTPAPDTVLAGAGAVRSGVGSGHLGPTPAGRPVHGQVVHVERLSRRADPALAEAVRRAGGRVVLVPWDYGPDCSPLPWGRSARWLGDSAHGLFAATLRDRAHWAGGVPTFDLTPASIPYTGHWAQRVGSKAVEKGLTPEELFELLATLPTADAVSDGLDEAYMPLRQWIAVHSALAEIAPVPAIVRDMEYTLSRIRTRRREVTLAGTWRVTVVLPEAGARATDSSTFYVRMSDRPSGTVGRGRAAHGVYAHACAHALEAALAGMREFGRCMGNATTGAEGYVAVGDSVWTDADGRRMRAGSFDLVAGDDAMRRRYRQLTMERMGATPEGDWRRFLPGAFTEWPDGRVTFELEGPTGFRVTAVRVSRDALLRGPE